MQLIILRKKRDKKKNKLNIEKLSTHEIEGLPWNVETTSEISGFEAAESLSNRAISPDIVGARN